MARSLGIVIPAYEPDLDRLLSFVQDLDEYLSPTTIRIELDDPSGFIAPLTTDTPAAVNTVSHRRGKGAAITDGFEALNTDILAFADADGSVPATSVSAVTEPIRTGVADLAVGSRRHPEATVQSHQSYLRRWLGHGFVRFARWLLEPRLFD
jgi:cellulose synthase/poly-beta-1,6-N-acetylglucosamine synthase-like glycosyltransferase